MPLPVLAKTWQYDVNQSLADTAAILTNDQQLLLAIKDSLIGFGTLPWTVRGSSNQEQMSLGSATAASPIVITTGQLHGLTTGSTVVITGATGTMAGALNGTHVITVITTSTFSIAGNGIGLVYSGGGLVTYGSAALDTVDRWTLRQDLVRPKNNSAHAWIVLRQTGIATNFEICLDLVSTTNFNLNFVVSYSAGFTGGSATARPTATDEAVVLSAPYGYSGAAVAYALHAMQSTDGKCTRIIVYRGTTNQCTFWLIDVPQFPVAGWTNPSIICCLAAQGGFANSYTTLADDDTSQTVGRVNGTPIAFHWGGESAGGTILAQLTNVGSVVNEISLVNSMFPIPMFSNRFEVRGRHGALFDIWWRSSSVAADATTFPNNAATRQFATLGNLVIPWTGDATDPLLV